MHDKVFGLHATQGKRYLLEEIEHQKDFGREGL
jgi:hypothetical protein